MTSSMAMRAAAAGAVLTLLLTACGGREETTSGTVTDTATEEVTEEETGSGTDGPAPEVEGEQTGPDADGLPDVEVTWPQGWVDLTMLLGEPAPGTGEILGYGEPEGNFAVSSFVVTFSPTFVDGRPYEELAATAGHDLTEHERLPEVEVDGRSVSPYETVIEDGEVPVRQHLYPVELEDGSLAEITFMAPDAEFDALRSTWDGILASLVLTPADG